MQKGELDCSLFYATHNTLPFILSESAVALSM